ncbi:chitinase [Streptacidiphilus sp. MAP5-52]|uniref:chitinase n=1 Tax=Streptacidiphilus sp. MAP5-52 TaxID=3156267 RepID=UPI003518E98F
MTDGGTCDPEWAGVTAVNDPTTSANIAALRAAGGDVRVSFGGENGTEIAANCSSPSTLAAAYQSVINQYQLTHIDFDIEGGAIADTATIDRRNQALAILERNNPSLKISYTLPVLPTGLTQDGVNLLTDAKTDGVTLDAVNVMAMDYGSSFSSDMGQDAVDAATATQAQIKSVWTNLTDAQAWSMVAVTPMIGLNDDTSETFSLADATTLVNFAKTEHLAWLSFWSATRDSQCSGGAITYTDPTCSSVLQTAGQYGQTMAAYTG